MFNLLLMLIFLRQCFYLRCRTCHVIHRIHHSFVVIRHRQVTLRFRNIEIRIQSAAVKDRQRQPGGYTHLLRGMAEQVTQM